MMVGILIFALIPALAQDNSGPGKIHGHVTNPAGMTETAGSVSLSTDGGDTLSFTFKVSSTGDYSGEAPGGLYMVIFREPDTPPGEVIDSFNNVLIVAGEDVRQDFDMSRKEFIDALPPETQKQLEEFKKNKAGNANSNDAIASLNNDLRTADQALKDADNARVVAAHELGSAAGKAALDAKAAKIRAAKYTAIETLMLKDAGLRPDASVIWLILGQARVGLNNYVDAEANLKKALDLESKAATPHADIQGAATAELGEIYARTEKIPEAEAAFDAAVKIDAGKATLYLMREAAIFSEAGNADAELAVAEEAIKNDPSQPIFYYLKGQGLLAKATVDPKTKKRVLPADCADAYKKYLELAPNGPYSAEAKTILARSGM